MRTSKILELLQRRGHEQDGLRCDEQHEATSSPPEAPRRRAGGALLAAARGRRGVRAPQATPPTHRVLIAGGGVAGLEALVALHTLAGDRMDLTLIEPASEFTMRAGSVATAFGHGEPPRYDMARMAADHGAFFLQDALHAVYGEDRTVRIKSGRELSYDSLLVAVGAQPLAAFADALTFRGPRDVTALRDLLHDIDAGRVGTIAFVVPPGVIWTLPLYELALLTARRAELRSLQVAVTIVTPEPEPLAVLGRRASLVVKDKLASRGIALLSRIHVQRVEGGALQDGRGQFAPRVDRVVALPRLTGPRIHGLPCDHEGFLPVDAYGAVPSVCCVYGAGDATTTPVKQGGLAAQQAEVAARKIARAAGAAVSTAPLRPVLRAHMLEDGEGAWVRHPLTSRASIEPTEASVISGEPLWWPAEKVVAPYLNEHLQASTREHALRQSSTVQRGWRSRQRLTLRSRSLVALGAVAIAVAGLLLTGALNDDRSIVRATVERAGRGTVLIDVRDTSGLRVGMGSGWVLDARAGLVVTSAHVTNTGQAFRVRARGRSRPAHVVSAAPCEDLALLRVPDRRGLQNLRLGSQANLRAGQRVLALGYPGNASLRDELTWTEGIVSVARTQYREAALDIPRYPNVIQIDAALNPGNSGGPLVDARGKLLGISSAGRSLAPDGSTVSGQGYAIGVDRAKAVLRVLRSGRSLGWTGTGFGYLTAAESRANGLPQGLLINHVIEGTPAQDAGLGRKVTLLVGVNDRPVRNSVASYCDAVRGIRSGQRATFTLVRPEHPAAEPRMLKVRFG